MSLPLELLLAALLGALHSLTFVHTGWWWLQLACVASVAWRVAAAAPARAAAIGLVFGTAWLASSTWWLYISLHDFGGLPGWLSVLAIGLLSAGLSLYFALAFAAFARWRSAGEAGGHAVSSAANALLFGATWLLAELARGVVFTGFPWVASGYAQVDAPLAALAPWVGVYGIGFALAALAAWPALAWNGAGRSLIAPIGGLAVALGSAAFFGPGEHTQPGATLNVTLLQGNVPQDQKFAQEQMPQALAWTSAQLLGARGDLVVAPETVIPLLPSQLDADYWRRVAEHFQRGSQAALIGLPLGNEDTGYTNSAAGLSAATAALPGGYYRYDKHHLVPFGEFIPTGFRWFTELMHIPLGDFNRGPVGAASFVFRGERIGANICYEDLFGEELAARFRVPASAPTVFANISNIAWFGDTSAIPQHLNISRLRSLEFERPMLRATNTGATAVIDHLGHVTHRLAPYTQGVLEGVVQGRTGLTPYAWWASRFGLGPLLLLGVSIAGAMALRRRSRRRPARAPFSAGHAP